jgi:hypothetical protein
MLGSSLGAPQLTSPQEGPSSVSMYVCIRFLPSSSIQFNSSAPRLISWQVDVPKLDFWLPTTLLYFVASSSCILGTDHTEDTASIFKEACLRAHCLAMDVLLYAYASKKMCSSSRCLAMDIHVTLSSSLFFFHSSSLWLLCNIYFRALVRLSRLVLKKSKWWHKADDTRQVRTHILQWRKEGRKRTSPTHGKLSPRYLVPCNRKSQQTIIVVLCDGGTFLYIRNCPLDFSSRPLFRL